MSLRDRRGHAKVQRRTLTRQKESGSRRRPRPRIARLLRQRRLDGAAQVRWRRRETIRPNHRATQRAPLCNRARWRDSIRAGDSRRDYGGDAIITGKFEEKEARGLASVLENPLQTPVSIEEERSVSPTLGMDSIRASIMAGLMGLAITLVCVLLYYRLPGLSPVSRSL